MGLLVGAVFYPIISVTKRHRLISWTFKVAAIPLAIILYVVLTRNFYTSDPYAGKSTHLASISYHFDFAVFSLLWLSILVMYPDECQQPLSRVRCPLLFMYSDVLTIVFSVELVRRSSGPTRGLSFIDSSFCCRFDHHHHQCSGHYRLSVRYL
jgi:hypothetical protein